MLDNLKNRSAKQQAASRANGAQGHGPVTAQGKERSSANALKHGLFASELHIPGEEHDNFEAFRQGLAAELKPNTDLLWIFFDDIVSLRWRMKLALRLEEDEIEQQLHAARDRRFDCEHAMPTMSRCEFAARIQESLRRNWLRMLQEYQRLKYGESKA